MKTKEKEKKKVKCPKCKNVWNTKSEYLYVVCPNCLNKVNTEGNKDE